MSAEIAFSDGTSSSQSQAGSNYFDEMYVTGWNVGTYFVAHGFYNVYEDTNLLRILSYAYTELTDPTNDYATLGAADINVRVSVTATVTVAAPSIVEVWSDYQAAVEASVDENNDNLQEPIAAMGSGGWEFATESTIAALGITAREAGDWSYKAYYDYFPTYVTLPAAGTYDLTVEATARSLKELPSTDFGDGMFAVLGGNPFGVEASLRFSPLTSTAAVSIVPEPTSGICLLALVALAAGSRKSRRSTDS